MLDTYKDYNAFIKVQWGVPAVKVFGCDHGGEFTSDEFTKYLKSQGTIRHLTVHDSSKSNGAAERTFQTMLNLTHAAMIQAGLPQNLWAEAIRHIIWVLNWTRISANAEDKMPHEIATG